MLPVLPYELEILQPLIDNIKNHYDDSWTTHSCTTQPYPYYQVVLKYLHLKPIQIVGYYRNFDQYAKISDLIRSLVSDEQQKILDTGNGIKLSVYEMETCYDGT
jgi:hypothetical protein